MAEETTLARLRLDLGSHNSELLLVGDVFAEGGRYVMLEFPRMETKDWTWLEWEDTYERLAREWHVRFGATRG